MVGGIVAISLVLGTVLGSVAVPVTRTYDEKQQSPVTTTLTTASHTQEGTNTSLACNVSNPYGISPTIAPVLFARQNATVSLCVAYYNYNTALAYTFNTSSLLHVGVYGSSVVTTKGNQSFPLQPKTMNFTIKATPNELEIGGPSYLNEGATGPLHN